MQDVKGRVFFQFLPFILSYKLLVDGPYEVRYGVIELEGVPPQSPAIMKVSSNSLSPFLIMASREFSLYAIILSNLSPFVGDFDLDDLALDGFELLTPTR